MRVSWGSCLVLVTGFLVIDLISTYVTGTFEMNTCIATIDEINLWTRIRRIEQSWRQVPWEDIGSISIDEYEAKSNLYPFY